MDPEMSTMFKALGDPKRLQIFEFLLDCCCPVAVGDEGDVRPFAGATAGEVCCSITGLDRINSTVSFHLKELRQAGLINMDRQGKHMVCSINREGLAKLAEYLKAASERGGVCATGEAK